MALALMIIFGVVGIVLIFIIIQLFRMSLNDFLEKTLKKTLWMWLPFHAFGRLTREFGEKYFK